MLQIRCGVQHVVEVLLLLKHCFLEDSQDPYLLCCFISFCSCLCLSLLSWLYYHEWNCQEPQKNLGEGDFMDLMQNSWVCARGILWENVLEVLNNNKKKFSLVGVFLVKVMGSLSWAWSSLKGLQCGQCQLVRSSWKHWQKFESINKEVSLSAKD